VIVTVPSWPIVTACAVGETAARDERAVGVGPQRAVARVGGGAVGQLDLEEALSVDREVELVARLLQVALGEHARRGSRAHAGANLQPGRQLCLLRRVGACLAHVLVQQVLERNTRALEAVRADVGEVVGNHVELRLLRVEAGLADPEAANHELLLPGWRIGTGASRAAKNDRISFR
jgi:hypothetical protein